MPNEIDKVAPPALPLAPETYDRPFMDQNNNVLRLFFNRFVGSVNTLLSTNVGGKVLYMPYGVFYSTVDQTAAVADTGYAVTFNSITASSAINVVSGSRITVVNPGVYHVKATLQLESTSGSSKTASLWLAKNGSNVAYSAHEYVVSGSSKKDVANWNGSVALVADDYIEVFWATDDTNIELHTHAAVAPRPAVASATIAVTFVSNV